MAKTREQLGFPPLLVYPDVFGSPVNVLSLNTKDRLKYELMTANDVNNSSIQHIIANLTDDYFDEEIPLRPKLYVGEYTVGEGETISVGKYTISEGETVSAWLTFKATGGKNIAMENKFSPVIYAGKDGKNKPNQVSLSKTTHKAITWDDAMEQLDNRNFTDCDDNVTLGLTNAVARLKAWKKVLLRVWAAAYPNALLTIAMDNDGGSTRDSLRGSSRKKQSSKRLAHGVEASGSTPRLTKRALKVLSDQDEKVVKKIKINARPPNRTAAELEEYGEDNEFESEAAQLAGFYGIQETSEWWDKFNDDPEHFDLDDPKVYEAIAHGRADMLGSVDIGVKDWPPVKVLQEAQKIVVEFHGEEKLKVDETTMFRVWENSQISGFKEDEEKVKLSLDERRAAQAKQRALDGGGQADALSDGLPAQGSGKDNENEEVEEQDVQVNGAEEEAGGFVPVEKGNQNMAQRLGFLRKTILN